MLECMMASVSSTNHTVFICVVLPLSTFPGWQRSRSLSSHAYAPCAALPMPVHCLCLHMNAVTCLYMNAVTCSTSHLVWPLSELRHKSYRLSMKRCKSVLQGRSWLLLQRRSTSRLPRASQRWPLRQAVSTTLSPTARSPRTAGRMRQRCLRTATLSQAMQRPCGTTWR